MPKAGDIELQRRQLAQQASRVRTRLRLVPAHDRAATELAEASCWYARYLLERGRTEDRERARSLQEAVSDS